MGVAREYRVSMERHEVCADEDPAPHRERVPGKWTAVEQLLARLEGRMLLPANEAKPSDPGRRTLAGDAAPGRAGFDDYRVLGLRDLLRKLGPDHALKPETIAAAAEADRSIAGRATLWQAMPHGAATPGGQAMWQAAERHAVMLYRRAVDNGVADPDDPAVELALQQRGAGQPLSTTLRRELEHELGVSLAGVRIHGDGVAARAAWTLRAEAFTVGEDIFFAEGAFAPDTRSGRKLLAHELTHVAQALRGIPRPAGGGLRVSQPDEPLEQEADAIARRVDVVAPLQVPARDDRAGSRRHDARDSHGLAGLFAPVRSGTLGQPSTIFRSPDPTSAALYPTQQERSDIQAVLNPQAAAAPNASVAAVTNPAGFRNAMRQRIVDYIDRVLVGAQATQSAPTTLAAGDLTSLGQVGQTQVMQFFSDYARPPPNFQLSQHLHFVPDNPPPATLSLGVRDWTASRMRARGGDLLENHNVLSGTSASPGRDQALFDSTRDDIIAQRTAALETIIRYFPGYELQGEAYIQPHVPAQQGESAQATLRRGRWTAFGTTLHEMMHQLADPAFRAAVSGIEESGIGIEGFAEYFTGEVYRNVQQRSSSDPALKAQIEGGPPPPYITPPERVPGTYARYVDGVNRIKAILGGNEASLRVAYFLGRVEYLGLGGWTPAEATTRRFPGNVLSAAALLDFGGQGGGVRVRYGRLVYGRGGAFQLDVGAGLTYLHSGAIPAMGATPAAPATDRLGVTGEAALHYAWPNVYVGAGLGVGGSAAVGAPFTDSIRLDVIPGFEAGAMIGHFRIGANLHLLVPVGGPVPERTVRILGGIGVSGEF